MLIIVSMVGGAGILGSNGVPEDDPNDWSKLVKEHEDVMLNI